MAKRYKTDIIKIIKSIMNWGNKIKELRLKLCYTQTEMAELLDVAFISINRYENHKSVPTMKVKRKLLKLMKKNNITEE